MSWLKFKTEANLLTKSIDTHFGPVISGVRFKSMKPQEICQLTMKYGSLMQYILDNENSSCVSRRLKWDDEAIIKYEIQKDGTEFVCKLLGEENTIFSMDEPLILGSFTCSRIRVNYLEPRDLPSSLPVDVEISEATDLNEGLIYATSNAKVVCKMKAELHSADTTVLLPQPILIRPSCFYKICIGQFPDEHVHYSKEFMRCDKSINIKFHFIKLLANRAMAGLVSTLNFNRL